MFDAHCKAEISAQKYVMGVYARCGYYPKPKAAYIRGYCEAIEYVLKKLQEQNDINIEYKDVSEGCDR